MRRWPPPRFWRLRAGLGRSGCAASPRLPRRRSGRGRRRPDPGRRPPAAGRPDAQALSARASAPAPRGPARKITRSGPVFGAFLSHRNPPRLRSASQPGRSQNGPVVVVCSRLHVGQVIGQEGVDKLCHAGTAAPAVTRSTAATSDESALETATERPQRRRKA